MVFQARIPFLRVLGRIDHNKFEECFLTWTGGYFRKRAQPGSVIAIDGKTVRGSASDRGIHLVSAWADELGLVLVDFTPIGAHC